MFRSNKFCLVAVLAMVTCVFVGCGGGGRDEGPLGSVEGKITVNGKPVPEGTTITFTSQAGDVGSGVTGADGAYTAEAPVGACQISIATAGEEIDGDVEMSGDVGSEPAADPIPVKYSSIDSNTETVVVAESGTTTYDLDMKP